jgi:hypothetical protein
MGHTIDNRSGAEIAASHPLLEWYGRMFPWGVEVAESTPGSGDWDILLSTLLSARFAIGIEADGQPVLGMLQSDVPHLLSVEWTSSALLRKFRGRGWLALSCADAGTDLGARPFRLRLFIPMAGDLVDRFADFPAKALRIRAMKLSKGGRLVVANGAPRADIVFSLKGFDA